MSNHQIGRRSTLRSLGWALAGLLASASIGATPAETLSSAEGRTAGTPPTDQVAVDASALDAITPAALTWNYLNVAGSIFQGRQSTDTFGPEGGVGCVHLTGGNRMETKLMLPEGAYIRYVRAFFKDESPQDLFVWLVKFDGAGTYEDLKSVASSGDSGYGTTLSNLVNYTVDHYESPLSLVMGSDVHDSSLELCGVRVAYYTAQQMLDDTIFRDDFD